MTAAEWVNWIEILLWGFISVVIFLHWLSKEREKLGLLGLALVFGGFALSDYVELRTGSWWEPWWLAVWKGGSILVIVCAGLRYFRNQSGCDDSGQDDA